MAPLRSLGNIRSAFDDFYARTGKDAVTAAPPGSFSATGGDTTFTDGGYKYHVWTTNGDGSPFNVSSGNGTVQYLIVAGGGGTGTSGGGGSGGGGGGGLINSSSTFTPGAYAVTVGAGGAGSPQDAITAGGDSKLGSFIAAGGGRGGHYAPGAGEYRRGATSSAGGSSGGAVGNDDAGTANVFAPTSPSFPSPAPGQGNVGGPATPAPGNDTGGGGGGGAGGAGGGPQQSPPKRAGLGGIGAAIPWVPPSYGTPGPDGSARYFAGGGGGGGQDLAGAAGGAGGGGTGTSRPPGASGTAGATNTGGGAGGPGSAPGANGGPGIVILRYPTT